MRDLARTPATPSGTLPGSVGWGILGPGRISRNFCNDLQLVPDAHVAAVGSRSLQRATDFCATYGGTAHGSYEALVADPSVDVVYVGSPHALHDQHARLAIDAGKAVLCEKPLTLDRASSQALIEHARQRGVFFMEAMWMTCNPLIQKVRRLLATEDYGTARQIHADLGFVVNSDPTDRLLDPALGASALLDMGIYPLTLATVMLGEPLKLTATASLADSGIDLNIAIAGLYPDGAVAALTASMTTQSPRSATIATEIGRFDFETNFHQPTSVTWTSYWEKQGTVTVIEPDEPVIGRGYGNEIVEVQRCLRAGLLESPMVPPTQTLAIMGQMDDLRAQLGIDYN